MKAIYCRACGDLYNLTTQIKSCTCGRTRGAYINKYRAKTKVTHHAWFIGKYAVPIGLCNITFFRAVHRKNKAKLGRFTAFVFERESPSFEDRSYLE